MIMLQEEKQLLLQDLCARLPYGVKFNYGGYDGCDYKVELITFAFVNDFPIEDIKPYLRPMSSMTEEEKVQLCQYACIGEDMNGEFIDEVQRKDCAAYIDWLNKKMFDYRGLIPMNLALEAPEGMYNIKWK